MDDDKLSRTNLNFFYTLDAILNSGSLTEAAQRASLTQPAISMALKKARAHFQDEIVVEIAGKRQLTPLAAALRPRVRHALRNARQILDFSLDFDPSIAQRTIRITMPDFVEVLLFPHILKAVRERAPLIDIHLIPFDPWPAERQFEKDIDFALLPDGLADKTMGHKALYTEMLGVIIASSNPIAQAQALQPAVVTPDQFARGRHAALFDAIDMLAPSEGPVAELLAKRTIVTRTATYATLPRLAVDNDLIVTTSARYGQYCASIMDLVQLPFPIVTDHVEIALHWQPFRDREPFVRWFVDLLGQVSRASI